MLLSSSLSSMSSSSATPPSLSSLQSISNVTAETWNYSPFFFLWFSCSQFSAAILPPWLWPGFWLPLFLQVSFGGGEVQAASTDLLKDFEQEGVDRTELCLRLLGKVYNFPSTIRLFYLRVFLSSTNSSTLMPTFWILQSSYSFYLGWSTFSLSTSRRTIGLGDSDAD